MRAIYSCEKKEPKMLDMETIRKINDCLFGKRQKRTESELKDWQWLIMLENESRDETWD